MQWELHKSHKEPVLPKIGQNWHDVNIDRMCTQCTLYCSSVLISCCFYLYYVHLKECSFGIFNQPIIQVCITKKELANVEIQEHTASL